MEELRQHPIASLVDLNCCIPSFFFLNNTEKRISLALHRYYPNPSKKTFGSSKSILPDRYLDHLTADGDKMSMWRKHPCSLTNWVTEYDLSDLATVSQNCECSWQNFCNVTIWPFATRAILETSFTLSKYLLHFKSCKSFVIFLFSSILSIS